MINYPEEKVFLYYAQRQVIDFSQGGIFSDGFDEITQYVLDSTTPEEEIIWKDTSPLKEFTRSMIDEYISALAAENRAMITELINSNKSSNSDVESKIIIDCVASRFITKSAVHKDYFSAYKELLVSEAEGREPVGVGVNKVWLDCGEEAPDWKQLNKYKTNATFLLTAGCL